MELNKLRFFWIGITVCTVITVGYIYVLYDDYKEKVEELSGLAKETFVEALILEVQKRGDIEVPFIIGDFSGMQTLTSSLPDSVTLMSQQGMKCYKIPHVKLENSIIKETKNRMLLTMLFEKYPLSADILNVSWDSLLVKKRVGMNTYVRLSMTDMLERTTNVYSKNDIKISQADSLLSRYMGFRCEIEATGYVSYNWLQVLNLWQTVFIFIFPWACFIILFKCYNSMISFLKRMLIKEKTIVQEKTVIVEKEIRVVGVEIEKAKIYRLEDGVIFDGEKHVLRKGVEVRSLPPQIVILLKLFLEAENHQLTLKEIDDNLWSGKGTTNRVHTVICRLRDALKDFSTLTVVVEKGVYSLKMPHSTEE